MILLPQSAGKRFGVVGLGKSGRATVASLLASGAEVWAWDDAAATRASIAEGFPRAKLHPVAEWDFTHFTALVMSPGIFLSHPAVLAANAAGVEVIGDIELLYRAAPNAQYIAITGTNGKSTTTSLIAHLLGACGKRVEVGGNLGVPALALAPLGADGVYVLELSSYQLDLVRTTRFNTAILLNITPDHLDHHGGMENYIAAKCHIFDRQQPGDVAIIGVDDAYSETIARAQIAAGITQVIPLSVTRAVTNGIWAKAAQLVATFGAPEQVGDLSHIRSLQGAHNWQNAAAAYAAAIGVGCTHDAVMKAMASYPGLPHRMQWLGESGGVQFVNDSKATNADAAEKALLTYDAIYWILGGVAKEGGIESLAPYFPKIRHAYLIGEAAESFARTLEGQVPYTISGTLDAAFHAAISAAQKDRNEGDSRIRGNDKLRSGEVIVPTVLLAPACASFDQFANFEVRGEAFMARVREIMKGDSHAATA